MFLYFNYDYYLSSTIYRWIETSIPIYSHFFRERDFRLEGTVRWFKHFCLPQLIVSQKNLNERLNITSLIIE